MKNFIIGFILRFVAVFSAVMAYIFIIHTVFGVEVTTLTRLMAVPVGFVALKVVNTFWNPRVRR